MKNLSFLILLLTLLSSCSEYGSHELRQANLRGEIKSVKSQKFLAVEKFGETQKSTSAEVIDNNELDALSNSLIEFDLNGETTSISLLSNGELNFKVVADGLVYNMYDNLGKLFMSIKVDSKELPKESNVYSASGDLVEKVKMTYNTDNELIEESSYDGSGDLVKTVSNSYEKGMIVQQSISEREEKYWGNGDFKDASIILKYNENKDVIEQEITRNSRIEKHTYEYEYDKIKNWIKRIQFTDKKPVSIVEREIVYY